MKSFSCGDVIPGCQRRFVARDDTALMQLVAQHADQDHGLTTLDPELVSQVRERIRSIS